MLVVNLMSVFQAGMFERGSEVAFGCTDAMGATQITGVEVDDSYALIHALRIQ